MRRGDGAAEQLRVGGNAAEAEQRKRSSGGGDAVDGRAAKAKRPSCGGDAAKAAERGGDGAA